MQTSFADKISFCGIELLPLTIAQLNETIARAIAEQRRVIVANHNLHSLHLFQRDPKLREFFSRAEVAHIDGMSLVLLARCLGFAVSRDQRVTYVDWVGPLMAEAERNGWRIFFLGSKPGVAERASSALKLRFPALKLVVEHGYFDISSGSEHNRRVIAAINDYQPHILMVGMGMPRQEHWIADYLPQLQANAILPAGACFDYIAGEVPTPPRWMGRMGLEWSYRLVSEPRRLWRRYLLEPLSLTPLVLKEMVHRTFGCPKRGRQSRRGENEA